MYGYRDWRHVPLPRERAKAPYSPAEIGAFLALADAQPTRERQMRAAGPGMTRVYRNFPEFVITTLSQVAYLSWPDATRRY